MLGQTQYYPVKTIAEAITCNSLALSGLKKKIGEKPLVASLVLMVNGLVKFYSVGKTMDSYQLGETARLIAQEFYYLKVEDLHVFFERMKTGHYGAMFDRIDGNVIMLHLRTYCEERFELGEKISLEKHKEVIDAEREEQYLIKVGTNWLKSVGENFEETDKKELATGYTYGVAVKLKQWLVRDEFSATPDVVKICDRSKYGMALFDYLEKNSPELLPKGEAFKRATNDYHVKKAEILADSSLSDFEKENKIRAVAGLIALTENEYKLQQKAYHGKV